MKIKIGAIALVLSILLRSAYSICPPEKNIKPCLCLNLYKKSPEVICEGNFIRNLHLNLKNEKFSTLKIQKTSIESIDDKEFSEAEFENVSIRGNRILTKIDENAFNKHPKYLTIEKNTKLAEENFYSLAKMLSNARTIIYRYNSIKTVPKNAFADSINNFLERIILNDNKIAVINPNSFNYLSKLRYLNLKNNLIVYLPEDAFSRNDQLEEIILENNRINFIDSNAFNILPKLLTLTLNNNNLTEVSGNMFSDVNNFLDIRLNNNKISKIKSSVFTKLRFLDSSFNLISYVIEDAINTTRHSETIKFSNNRISNLSTTFNNFTKLKVLELINNLVTEVTDCSFIGSDQLEFIYLTNNKITQIGRNAFSHMKKLKYLDLTNNSITEIPEELFSQNSQLEFILLKHNQVTQIKPKTFHYLYKLQRLGLSHNYITTIGSKSINIFGSSHLSIHFESNKLTENSFNKNSFVFDDKNSQIKLSIYFDNNQFTTIPKQIFLQIFGLSLKSEIHLNGNKFDCNCDMIWLNENGIRNKIKGQIQCNNFEGAQLFDLNEYEVCNKSTLIASTQINSINLLTNSNNLIGTQKLKKNKQIKTYNYEGIKCLTDILELSYFQTPLSKNVIYRIDI